MAGEFPRDARAGRSARQAMLAIAASLLAVGSIIVLADGDSSSSSVTAPLELSTAPTVTVAPTVTAAPTTTSTSTSTTTGSTVTVTTVTTTVAPAPAVTGVAPANIDAKAYAVYDVTGGRWLGELQGDAALPVGSVMKLLTSYVVLQAGDLAKVVTVPDLQLDPSESAIGLYRGERLSREVLLRAMLIVSANDAARTLAVDVAGSAEAFVGQMNDAATALGLSSTVAANPVGLDAVGASSSARDVITLAVRLMQDPTFRDAVARPSASLHGQTFASTNKLLGAYAGATGVKTGHTSAAGYCLVGSATRNGRTVIVAVLGASSDGRRLASAKALLDWAFAQP